MLSTSTAQKPRLNSHAAVSNTTLEGVVLRWNTRHNFGIVDAGGREYFLGLATVRRWLGVDIDALPASTGIRFRLGVRRPFEQTTQAGIRATLPAIGWLERDN